MNSVIDEINFQIDFANGNIPLLPSLHAYTRRGCDKCKYMDKRAAVSQINRLKVIRASRNAHNLRPYYCNRCNAWHLTHKELNK